MMRKNVEAPKKRKDISVLNFMVLKIGIKIRPF